MKENGGIEKLSDLSVYDIDIFQDMLQVLSTFLVHPYPSRATTDLDIHVATSYRIIADHVRSAIMLVDE